MLARLNNNFSCAAHLLRFRCCAFVVLRARSSVRLSVRLRAPLSPLLLLLLLLLLLRSFTILTCLRIRFSQTPLPPSWSFRLLTRSLS